ncbi:MAG TPA: DUF4440 domain-containing protein [Gemmatimonadales bacterium]|nr:DUF4440 domain-containing protein [Gemmatimonadales bacterium]
MIALLLLVVLQGGADSQYQRFSTAYATLDPDRVIELYAEDALMLPPGGEIVRGRAAIRERYADGFENDRERGHTRRITFELVERVEAGNLRSDYGYYTIVGRNPQGEEHRFRGKFSKVWRRDKDGVWRIKSDSYSAAAKP